jgi:hypothetical protein
VDACTELTLRVEGVAELAFERDLMARYPECQFVVLVRATAICPNCPRYVHQRTLVERSPFVPRSGVATPTEWKRSDWPAMSWRRATRPRIAADGRQTGSAAG